MVGDLVGCRAPRAAIRPDIAPEERITVEQALTLYTRNGAYVGFEEHEKGSLEPGKLADFIVIDRDVLSVPSDEIKDVQVLQTYVGGKLVYDKILSFQFGESASALNWHKRNQ